MTLGLYDLSQEYVATHDQILGSPIVPTVASAHLHFLVFL